MSFNNSISRRCFLLKSSLALLATGIGLPNRLVAAELLNTQNPSERNDAVFDRKLARLLLETCRYTYSRAFPNVQNEINDLKNALDWMKNDVGEPKIIPLDDGKDNSTSFVCLFCYPDKNIVSYMGTKTDFNNPQNRLESTLDWVENAKVVLNEFKMTNKELGLGDNDEEVSLGGYVHDGFLQELRAVQAKIIEKLMEEGNGGKTRDLYITGHSQGGAEATLATFAFLKGGFNVKATYSFAAPRSGNKDVKNLLPSDFSFYRIEYGNDIVPHVPSTYYTHVTIQQFIQKVSHPSLFSNFPFFGFINKLPHSEWISNMSNDILTAGFTKLGLLKNSANNLDEKYNLVGIGRLCYGNNDNRKLRVDISDEDEADLFQQRLSELFFALKNNPEELADHHHLAGTNAEVKSGKKGNYTALVSDFSEA